MRNCQLVDPAPEILNLPSPPPPVVSEPVQGGSNSEQERFKSATPPEQQASEPENSSLPGSREPQPLPGHDNCGIQGGCAYIRSGRQSNVRLQKNVVCTYMQLRIWHTWHTYVDCTMSIVSVRKSILVTYIAYVPPQWRQPYAQQASPPRIPAVPRPVHVPVWPGRVHSTTVKKAARVWCEISRSRSRHTYGKYYFTLYAGKPLLPKGFCCMNRTGRCRWMIGKGG